MKTTQEAIRTLQKTGEYTFSGLSREESRAAAAELAKAAMKADRAIGITSRYGIARDAFGYYSARQISD